MAAPPDGGGDPHATGMVGLDYDEDDQYFDRLNAAMATQQARDPPDPSSVRGSTPAKGSQKGHAQGTGKGKAKLGRQHGKSGDLKGKASGDPSLAIHSPVDRPKDATVVIPDKTEQDTDNTPVPVPSVTRTAEGSGRDAVPKASKDTPRGRDDQERGGKGHGEIDSLAVSSAVGSSFTEQLGWTKSLDTDFGQSSQGASPISRTSRHSASSFGYEIDSERSKSVTRGETNLVQHQYEQLQEAMNELVPNAEREERKGQGRNQPAAKPSAADVDQSEWSEYASWVKPEDPSEGLKPQLTEPDVRDTGQRPRLATRDDVPPNVRGEESAKRPESNVQSFDVAGSSDRLGSPESIPRMDTDPRFTTPGSENTHSLPGLTEGKFHF